MPIVDPGEGNSTEKDIENKLVIKKKKNLGRKVTMASVRRTETVA